MKAKDKTSYLMIACALLLARSRKYSLAKALSGVPLCGRARRLADRLAAVQPMSPHALPETMQAEAQRLVNSCNKNWQTFSPTESPVHPLFGSQHVSRKGAVTEIHLTDTRLRCPVCSNTGTFALDTWQMEHLRIRGHLELYCGYCGADSLWAPAKTAEKQPSELVI
ncbi:MAG: hypothetical protein HY651_11450 [Acidobacteria bacterium]|nr:hypothetical protein [Acidobacteriota bacterium]